MSLGKKIREIRIAKGLTQSDLGSGLVTPSMISQIESDKANPSYKVLEAIAAKLDTPLEHFLVDIQTQLEQTSAHKVARALLVSQNYERASNLLESLIDSPSLNVNALDIKTDLAECYLHLSRFDDATRLFDEVMEIALEKQNQITYLIALNKRGVIEASRQKYHLAIHFWIKAYECFDSMTQPEHFLQSQILNNLGTIHYQIGDLEGALTYFNKAHEFLVSSNQIEQVGFAYLDLGQSCRKMQQFEKAAEYSQYAIAIFESLKNIKMAIELKKNYGILRGEEGNIEEAMSVFQECIEEFERHQYVIEAAKVRGEIARLHLREQRYADCIAECETALMTIPNTEKEVAPILRTIALAEDALGHLDKAIETMEQVIAVIKPYKRLGELADTYSLLGDLYQKNNNLKKANECLQNMKLVLTDNLKERGIIL